MLFDLYHLYRLRFSLVHRMPLILDLRKVDVIQVDTANGVVVRSLVVYFAIGEVNRRSPLCGAWDVRTLAFLVLNADRYVKVVENVETLCHSTESVRALWRSIAEEGCANKTRWRCGITRESEHSRVAPKGTQRLLSK